MGHNRNIDALNDYLDSLAGTPPAESRAGDLDPDLRDGVDRFFELAEAARAVPRATTDSGRSDMTTTLPVSTITPMPRSSRRPGSTLPNWTQHLHLLSTVLMFGAVIALAVIAAASYQAGDGDDGTRLNGAVPVATVPGDDEPSSIPEPTAEECTVDPMTRDDVIQHLTESNTAATPDVSLYEPFVQPSDEEAQGIMQTFREWQACQGQPSRLRLQTPWFTLNHDSTVFRDAEGNDLRPVSDEAIAEAADAHMASDVYVPEGQPGTPPPAPAEQDTVPIPAGATPAARPPEGRSFPTIFAEDIVITGPDRATATAYFVNTETREVVPDTPDLHFEFVRIDGQWFIDGYREGGLG